MFKNAVIALLSTSLLFTHEAYAGFDMITYIIMFAWFFMMLCGIEYSIEKAWNFHMRKIDFVRKFKRNTKKYLNHTDQS